MAKLQLKPNNIYPFGDFFQFLDSLTAKLLTLIAMMIIIQNIVSWGCVRSPFLHRSTPFRALQRLIGLLERAVGQVLGGF